MKEIQKKTETKRRKIVCPKCNGKGFLEYQAGLIRVVCPRCKGTGFIKVESNKGKKKK